MKSQLQQATLCFLIRGEEVLLAMKKRGFGKDKWNGVGGKLNPGETLEQAMVRETQEEIGVTLLNLHPVATILFYFPKDRAGWNQKVQVFTSNEWQGEPIESEEMRPQWFKKNAIPFDKMWVDDAYWLPQVLSGKKLQAEFTFGLDEKIENFSINEIVV